jgi:hypothetical protein
LTCDDVTPRLTAYVDGELDVATGSVVRGHLRTCAACRVAAEDEFAVRDAMAKLPAPDVPSGLWRGISAQLADAEVADSKRSRWWLWWQSARPRLAPAAVVALAAVLVVTAWVRRGGDDGEPARPAPETVATRPVMEIHPVIQPSVGLDCDLHAATSSGDAAGAITGMGAAIDRCYQAAADELYAIVAEDRLGWPERRARAFDAELDAARRAVTIATAGRPRERAWQAVIQFLQRAVTVPVVAEVVP